MRVQRLSKYFFGALTAAALVVTTSTANAQSTAAGQTATAGATVTPRRAAARAKLQAMTPAERKIAKAKLRHRVRKSARKHAAKRAGNATPAQKQWAKSASVENKTLRAGVKAGTLSKESAMAQRKAWRQANPRPAGSGAGN